jgi:hypothetical protein
MRRASLSPSPPISGHDFPPSAISPWITQNKWSILPRRAPRVCATIRRGGPPHTQGGPNGSARSLPAPSRAVSSRPMSATLLASFFAAHCALAPANRGSHTAAAPYASIHRRRRFHRHILFPHSSPRSCGTLRHAWAAAILAGDDPRSQTCGKLRHARSPATRDDPRHSICAACPLFPDPAAACGMPGCPFSLRVLRALPVHSSSGPAASCGMPARSLYSPLPAGEGLGVRSSDPAASCGMPGCLLCPRKRGRG